MSRTSSTQCRACIETLTCCSLSDVQVLNGKVKHVAQDLQVIKLAEACRKLPDKRLGEVALEIEQLLR
jgi:hypothetical protein